VGTNTREEDDDQEEDIGKIGAQKGETLKKISSG